MTVVTRGPLGRVETGAEGVAFFLAGFSLCSGFTFFRAGSSFSSALRFREGFSFGPSVDASVTLPLVVGSFLVVAAFLLAAFAMVELDFALVDFGLDSAAASTAFALLLSVLVVLARDGRVAGTGASATLVALRLGGMMVDARF